MSYAPVSIQACADYEEATVRQSMGLVLRQMDALNFVRPGMTVAIKVNHIIPFIGSLSKVGAQGLIVPLVGVFARALQRPFPIFHFFQLQ